MLGSTVLVTVQNGAIEQQYEYEPFGASIGAAGMSPFGGSPIGGEDNRYQFTGQEFDPESELYYYNARYFNPALGRFISRDPMPGRDSDALSRNGYIYVKNNPLKYVDPSETTVEREKELKAEESWWINLLTNSNFQSGVQKAEAITKFFLDIPTFGGASRAEELSQKIEKEGLTATNLALVYGNTLISSAVGALSALDVGVGLGVGFNSLRNIERKLPTGMRSYDVNKLLKTQPMEAVNTREVKRMIDLINAKGPSSLPPISIYVRDGNAYVVDGHHRLEAFIQAGYNRVPIQYVHENQLKQFGRSFIEMKSWVEKVN